MLNIAIIVGSTRPGRNAATVADWVLREAAGRSDATLETLDLAEFDLPHLDEPLPPAVAEAARRRPHTQRWSQSIAAFDAFIFVTPEYNHSFPAALKTAIDFLYHEWNDKAAGFVSYGLHGGSRAVEQLRPVMSELKIADVRTQVALSIADDSVDMTATRPRPHHAASLARMLDELVAWGGALRRLRHENEGAGHGHDPVAGSRSI